MPASIPNDIYQYSLHSAYAAGLREGGPPVAFLTNHGTHGIGFFESYADAPEDRPGDMIQLDSIAYEINKDGNAAVADKQHQMPFVKVVVFQPSKRVKLETSTGSKKVLEILQMGRNTPMSVRIKGPFKYLNTQQETFWDVSGEVFGYAIPSWQKDVSGEGLQSCFITQDKKKGGRVVDFETGEGAILEWAKCGRFHLGFPQDEEYEKLSL
ncbi:hypothetical protein KC315_g1083 [Hortaea werneckii]|uniref:Alpha-acetolactate decarboxylase n=1 Tax=Hortaea werneckii TaxID=91943 RepID=A0A3M7EAY6_HORWE|nr:hypothetical protein KC315_g1083 [Hortaea werneckii]KAI7368687.1 hypothetical protein KC354_g2515 [Hortaea werneckii]RMY73741.1 hypothetical protein D0863_03677 [Hortaea werneckii]